MTGSGEELADRIHDLAIRLMRRVRADSESELTAARLSALSVLVFDGPRSVGELAAAEQVAAPTMSRLVTALERDGYVAREDDGVEGRGPVVVTPAGVRALETARARRVERLASLLEDVDPEDQASLLEATEIVRSALEGEPASRP